MSDAPAPSPPDTTAPSPREEAPGGVAALVLGILGLTLVPFILSIVALVVGHRSKREAEAHPERYRDELGRVGRILGWVGVALGVFALLAFIVAMLFFFSGGSPMMDFDGVDMGAVGLG